MLTDLELMEVPNDDSTSGKRRSAEEARSIRLLLSGTQGLVRKLSDLKLPYSQTRSMARLDVVASTPMPLKSVNLFFESDPTSIGGTHYLILKTAMVKEICHKMHEASVRPKQLELIADGKNFAVEWSDMQSMDLKSRFDWQPRRALAAALVATTFVCLATSGHELWRLKQASAAVDANLDLAEAQVRVLTSQRRQRQKRLQQVEAVRTARSQQIPISTVWEELTRLVPDSAWITDLSVSTQEVNFSGFARSAAGLIPVLETSRFFKNPAISGRVLRSTETTSERFTIRLEPET